MKKIALFLFLALLFIGCGGGGSGDSFKKGNENEEISKNELSSLPLISFLPIEGGIHEMALSSDRSYLFAANSQKLFTIDIKNPKKPQIVSSIPLINGEYTPYDMVVSSKDEIYVVGDLFALFSRSFNPYLFLTVIDAKDKKNPKVSGTLILEGEARSIKLSKENDKAFIASGNLFSKEPKGEILIVDIENPSDLKPIKSVKLNAFPYSLSISKEKDRLYVAKGSEGFEIIEILSTLEPISIASYETGSFVRDIEVSENDQTLFLAQESKGVAIYDIVDPSFANLLSSVKHLLMSNIVETTLSEEDKILFACGGKSGVFAIDISNLSFPKTIALFKSDGSIQKAIVLKEKNALLLADNKKGLKIADIKELK